jgi:CubicO group peptidase (beta-lactamase class C family)
MRGERKGRRVAFLLALVALSGGALRAVRSSTEAPAERNLTLPSGATLKVAGDWKVTESKDGLTLEDPEQQLKLEKFIDEMRDAADVPGVSVLLFDKDKTIIEKGFGVRERGRPEPVTADSLYIIASNTKALTTLLLARLVDEGRFDWETPVVKIYPSFKIGDPEVTKRVLLRHLVCACTGLPRQDFEWLFTFDRSSPQGQLDVLATMKPTTEFGALFQYSNPLASAAGYIGAHTVEPDAELGQAYDDVMREKVFRPLGMSRTTFSFDEALKTDHASPHSWDMSLKNVPIDMVLHPRYASARSPGTAWASGWKTSRASASSAMADRCSATRATSSSCLTWMSAA